MHIPDSIDLREIAKSIIQPNHIMGLNYDYLMKFIRGEKDMPNWLRIELKRLTNGRLKL